MRCVECETIDNHLYDTTHLWVFLATLDGFGKFAKLCADMELGVQQFDSRGFRVEMTRDVARPFLTAMMGTFNGQELAEMRVVTTERPTLEPADIGRVFSGKTFINRLESQWIVDALEGETYESWFQPIVHASGALQGRSFGHEALFRLQDPVGKIIPPGHVFSVASQSDLLFTLDLIARRCAVESAAAAGLTGKLFINFNPSSIYDPAYCLRTTVAAVVEVGLKPEDIVFELTETHTARDTAHMKGILAFYRNAGFGVALDDIGAGWSGLNMLHEMRPDYVKIDMDLVRGIDTDDFRQAIVKRVLQIARDNSIKAIAEGVETEAEANLLRGLGADYLQGFYFGRPAAKLPLVAAS